MMRWLVGNPYVWCALVAFYLCSVGFAFFKGKDYADRSAEVTALKGTVARWERAYAEMAAMADRNSLIADTAQARQRAAEELVDELQAKVQTAADEAEKRLPVQSVCRLNGDELDRLRALAQRANSLAKRGAPATQPVR